MADENGRGSVLEEACIFSWYLSITVFSPNCNPLLDTFNQSYFNDYTRSALPFAHRKYLISLQGVESNLKIAVWGEWVRERKSIAEVLNPTTRLSCFKHFFYD